MSSSPISSADIDRIGISIVTLKTHQEGWVFREQPVRDHGIDAHIEVFHKGRATGRLIALQIKTGLSYFKEENEEGYVFRDTQHLQYWLDHSLNVLVILVHPETHETFWQRITRAVITETGKGWKTTIPKRNRFDSAAFAAFSEMAASLKIHRPYSILNLEDISHAGAKRYGRNILLNGDFPQYYLESLASEINQVTALETWVEKPQLKSLFADRPADVVWLYFFRTIDDVAQYNFYFRTQWISPNLSPDFRPLMMETDHGVGTLEFHWSGHRDAMEELAVKHEVSKEDAVIRAALLVQQMDTHLSKWLRELQQVANGEGNWDTFKTLLREAADQAHKIYQENDLPLPPYELEDFYQTLESAVALFDNIFLPYGTLTEATMTPQSARGITKQALREFKKQRLLLKQKAQLARISLTQNF